MRPTVPRGLSHFSLCTKKSTIATTTLYRVILVFKVQHSFRESFSGSYNVRCYKTICTSSTLTSYKHYQSLFMYGIQRLFLSRSVHHIHPPYILYILLVFENHTRCNQPINYHASCKLINDRP